MMPAVLRVALIGDYDAGILAHQTIPAALQLSAQQLGVRAEPEWLSTTAATSTERLSGYKAIWCVPGSPYRSMRGALNAIRHARETGVPFLGTCGGFQHAVLEYARDVLGWQDAEHAESAPDAKRAVIALLPCAPLRRPGRVYFTEGSRLAAAYGTPSASEAYQCSYGANPAYAAELFGGALRVTARDEAGEVRGVELDGHPFFVATLFQPERAAGAGLRVPVVEALLAAAVRATGR